MQRIDASRNGRRLYSGIWSLALLAAHHSGDHTRRDAQTSQRGDTRRGPAGFPRSNVEVHGVFISLTVVECIGVHAVSTAPKASAASELLKHMDSLRRPAAAG
jgi:hypothetical protein